MLIRIEIVTEKNRRINLRRDLMLNIEINITEKSTATYKKMTIN
jgi:hypothetical protein